MWQQADRNMLARYERPTQVDKALYFYYNIKDISYI